MCVIGLDAGKAVSPKGNGDECLWVSLANIVGKSS